MAETATATDPFAAYKPPRGKPKPLTNGSPDIEFSENRLSREFAERYERELKYVAAWGSWYSWDGKRWLRERTLKAYEMAKILTEEAVDRGGDPKRLLSA